MPKQTISKQTKPREIDFDKMQGLLPAIVQDAASGDVLMLGFMNREAFEQTMRVGYVTFFSRSRNQLWTKGETSGNRLEVISASTDCDRDTVLLQVRVQGEGLVCHNGTRSCFTESLPVTKQPVQAEGSLP
jgi:phosphoribosyl-ATP pyrophosphohydrolase/phosphoribosyl-AMP cyclohydrolase